MADAPKPTAPAAAATAPAALAAGAATGGASVAPAAAAGASAAQSGAASPAAVAAPANSGEPPFKLKLEPSDFISFKTDKFPPEDGAVVDVKITNTTKQLQCYKVKCTSNEIFRVRPPLGYVKQDETFTVKFSLIAKSLPDLTKHFFAFYHVGVEDDAKTARQVWTPTTKPDGVTRVPVKFLKADGSPWTASAPAAGNGAPGASPAAAAAPAAGAAAPTAAAATDSPAATAGSAAPSPAK